MITHVQDIWDLFFFLPGAPDASRFDPTSIGCTPSAPAPAPPAEGYSRSAVIFSAVFGTVFGALFVSAAGYMCYRRWRSENPAPAEPARRPCRLSLAARWRSAASLLQDTLAVCG